MSESHGPARGYSWPPFERGNQVAHRSGAHSPTKVGPLAVEIEQRARASAGWPPYLDGPEYAVAVTAWARAEAVAELLWRHLAEQDVAAALAEVEVEDVEETSGKGRSRRRSTARRTKAALDWFQRAERSAALHRQRLGLDPLSRARLGKDVATSAVQAGMAQLHADGAELVARARAAGALPATPPDPAAPASGAHGPQEDQP